MPQQMISIKSPGVRTTDSGIARNFVYMTA